MGVPYVLGIETFLFTAARGINLPTDTKFNLKPSMDLWLAPSGTVRKYGPWYINYTSKISYKKTVLSHSIYKKKIIILKTNAVLNKVIYLSNIKTAI